LFSEDRFKSKNYENEIHERATRRRNVSRQDDAVLGSGIKMIKKHDIMTRALKKNHKIFLNVMEMPYKST